MNVNTYNAKSFHDARISIPKAFKSRVFRDEHWTPSAAWDWFEVEPGKFQLNESLKAAKQHHAKQPGNARTEVYIRSRYGELRDVTDQHEV